MLRLGLVGYGRWGRNYIQAAKETGLARVTSILLRPTSPAWQEATVNSFGPTSDINKLDVDAVVVAVHPSSAPEICEMLLQRGVPVMVEKPASLTLASAQRIERAAIKAQLPVLVSHQHLFASAYENLRLMVMGGRIRSIHTRAGGFGPHRDYSALWDYGPHDIAMILGLMGTDPTTVGWRVEKRPTGSWFELTMNFISGTTSSTEIWNDQGPKVRLLRVTVDGHLWVYDDMDTEARLRQDGVSCNYSYERPLTRALRAFLSAVHEGGTDDYRFGAVWAVRVARVLEKIE